IQVMRTSRLRPSRVTARGLAINLSISLIAIAFGLVLAEIGLRIIRYGDDLPDVKPPAYAQVSHEFRRTMRNC
ncbi:MAG: hypothetical protein AAB427_06745, partial [Chloroflexota bacterium]